MIQSRHLYTIFFHLFVLFIMYVEFIRGKYEQDRDEMEKYRREVAKGMGGD